MSMPAPVVTFTLTDLGSATPAIISVSHSESRALGPREKRRGSDKAALYCDLLEFSESVGPMPGFEVQAYFFLSRLIFFAISSTSFGFNSAKTLSTMLAIAADSAFESLELGAAVCSLSASAWVAGGSGG